MSSVWRSASSYKRGLLNLVSANHICNHIPRIMPNLCVCQGFDMLAQSDDYHALFAHLAVGKINNEIQHQFRQQALRAGSKPRRGFGHCQRLHLTAFSNTRKSFLGISSTVYGRMTLAIKAILSVSRVAPCFRLAQRQQKDNFQIHYQYTVGPPNLSLLGEDMQTRRIAAVATPVGTISVSLSYTTNLQMPYKVRKGTMFHVKDDHFSQPSIGHFSEPKPCNRKFRK